MVTSLKVKRYVNAISAAQILGMSVLACPNILADKSPSAYSQPRAKCQTDLQKFSIHLSKYANERPDQGYYANLNQHIQEFLHSIDQNPRMAPQQIDKCKSLLYAAHAIVGIHDIELAPMPIYENKISGKLSPVLESTVSKRPMRDRKSIHYVYVSKEQKGQKKNGGKEELTEEMSEFQLTATSLTRSLRTKSKENQDLE